MSTEYDQAKASANEQPASPWETALNKLREWDPEWAEGCVQMTTNPCTDGILPIKFIELVNLALNAARTGRTQGKRATTSALRLQPARAARKSCSFSSARP